MKSILFVIFLVFGMSVYASNTGIKNHLSLELDSAILAKEIPLSTKITGEKTNENIIAYNSYYAFEWLYKDSPFIKKLIVLA